MFFKYLASQSLQVPVYYTFPFQVYCPIPKNFSETEQQNSSNSTTFKAEIPPQDIKPQRIQDKFPSKLQNSKIQKNYKDQKPSQKKFLKKNITNDEYHPDYEAQSGKKNGKQNKLRNITPNIMHQIFTFVQKKPRSIKLVGKLLKVYGHNLATIDRFYLYQTLIKQKINNYINEDAFKFYCILHQPKCQVFSQGQQIIYLKISRLLIKYFIDNEVRINVLTSARMKTQTKIGHFKVLRTIQQRMQKIYRD